MQATFTALIQAAVNGGSIRADVPSAELARYVLHAVKSVVKATDPGSTDRLVRLTMDGLRPPTA